MTTTTSARRALTTALLDRAATGTLLAAEVPLLRAVIAAEQADADRAADYDNRITWETNCGEHARLLDNCRAAEEGAELAAAAILRTQEHCQAVRDREGPSGMINASQILGLLSPTWPDGNYVASSPTPPARSTRLCHDTDPTTLKECALHHGHDGDHADANVTWPRQPARSDRCIHVRDGGCCSGPGYCAHACNSDAPGPPVHSPETVDQAIGIVADEIARRAVEGNGTGQMLGVISGTSTVNPLPGLPVTPEGVVPPGVVPTFTVPCRNCDALVDVPGDITLTGDGTLPGHTCPTTDTPSEPQP